MFQRLYTPSTWVRVAVTPMSLGLARQSQRRQGAAERCWSRRQHTMLGSQHSQMPQQRLGIPQGAIQGVHVGATTHSSLSSAWANDKEPMRHPNCPPKKTWVNETTTVLTKAEDYPIQGVLVDQRTNFYGLFVGGPRVGEQDPAHLHLGPKTLTFSLLGGP